MCYRPDQNSRAFYFAQTTSLAITARELDREADLQLALGHHIIAERLSRQAEDLRESAQ
jgi:hypothetical protein